MQQSALLITTWEGYGDLVYHTPTIRTFSKYFKHLDVWCRRSEPFLNNPYIRNLQTYKDDFPKPPDIYNDRTFIVTVPSYIHLSHSRIHTVDLISIKALRLVLRDSEKTLEAYWKEEDLQRVKSLLLNHPLAEKNHILEGNFVVISPAITWPSRTLPLAYYQELITAIQKKGIGVILVGKDITYQRGVDCNKTLYPSEFFQDAISLYNQLTFAELAALYSITPIAINTENGNNPISCTNDFCWNLYIPSLTAPEFRLPFRHGSQKYKTAVAANDLDYYPSCIHGDTGMNSYLNMPVLFPTVSHVLEMLDRIRTKIRENAHFLT